VEAGMIEHFIHQYWPERIERFVITLGADDSF
jgi:hypothetical protein